MVALLHNLWIPLVAVIVLAAITGTLKTQKNEGRKDHRYKRKEFLNGTEQRVLKELKRRAPEDVAICPLVRLADVVAPTEGRKGINQIIQKHVDFVVYSTKDNFILSVIEIDGIHHEEEKQRKRDNSKDRILASAGIRMHRIKSHEWQNPKVLAEVFKDERDDRVPRPVQA